MRYSRQIPDLFTNVYKKAFPFSAKQGRRVASQITRGNVTIHFNFFPSILILFLLHLSKHVIVNEFFFFAGEKSRISFVGV